MNNSYYIINSALILIMLWKSDFIGRKLGTISKPDNLRRLHSKNTPQVGGIIFLLSLLSLFFFDFQIINTIINDLTGSSNLKKFFFILSFILLFFLGLIDDRKDLNPNVKILLLIFISFILFNSLTNYQLNYLKLSFYKDIDLYQYSSLIFIFFFVFLINAMNMFDGINLQSALYYLIIWTYISIYVGIDLLILNTFIFLFLFSFFNYKGHLFLGDCGSYILTFLSFIYLLKIYHTVAFKVTIDEFFILFLLPTIDCLRVIFTRIINKKNPFLGDNNHFHHIIIKKLNYKPGIFIIFIFSATPIIIYKLIYLNFFVIVLIFLFFYFISLNPKILNNKKLK